MNGAPQLFFSRRALAVAGPADRARARHPAPRRAKNIPALAAYRREVRRTRSLPVWQNSYVRVRVLRFFLADNQEFGSGYEEHALAREHYGAAMTSMAGWSDDEVRFDEAHLEQGLLARAHQRGILC